MKKLQFIFLCVSLVCILSVVISSLAISALAYKLDCQNVTERWVSDGTGYAQLSAFLTPDAGVNGHSVRRGLAEALDKALLDASLEASDSDARIYALSYTAETSGNIQIADSYGKLKNISVSATVTACGMDYFLFHPKKLLAGYYFNTDDLLNDCVIIDNDIAWQFFGSHDVVGRSLKLNGRDVYISGVCENMREGDYREFGGDKPRIYISYSLAEELYGEIYCEAVEILLPNPVDGFALDMFTSCFGVSADEAVYVENSERFGDAFLYKRLGEFRNYGVKLDSTVYPYFENTAQVLLNKAAHLYIFKLVPIIILSLILLSEIVILYIKRGAIILEVKTKASEFLKKRKKERQYKNEAKNINVR